MQMFDQKLGSVSNMAFSYFRFSHFSLHDGQSGIEDRPG